MLFFIIVMYSLLGYGTITVQADVCSIVPSVDHACYRHTLYTIYVLPRVGNHYFLIR